MRFGHIGEKALNAVMRLHPLIKLSGQKEAVERFARRMEQDLHKVKTADAQRLPTDAPGEASTRTPTSTDVVEDASATAGSASTPVDAQSKDVPLEDWRPMDCAACHIGKQKRQPFNKTNMRPATRVLGRIHCDVKIMLNQPALGGERYMLGLIDEYTSFGTVLCWISNPMLKLRGPNFAPRWSACIKRPF